MVLDVAQLLLPHSRQLNAGQQLFVYGVDELDACWRRHKILSLATYVMALKQRLDDTSARRWPPDAVLLHGSRQLLIVDQFACCFHGTQKRRLGVMLGRDCHLLGERRLVLARFSLNESGQRFLLGISLRALIDRLFLLRINIAPAGLKDLLARRLEPYVIDLTIDCGSGEQAIGIERSHKAPRYQVVNFLLHIGKTRRNDTRGDDGVVIGYLRSVEHTLRLGQFFTHGRQVLYDGKIRFRSRNHVLAHAIEDARTLGIDVVGQILRIGGEFLFVKTLYQVERQL